MHQARHRHVRIFAAWIGHVVRRCPRFFDSGNDLAPNRIVRIFSAGNQIEKMRRHGKREFVAGKQHTAAFLLTEINMSLELGERRNAVFKLPFPIVPEFRRDLRPITGRVRDERFPIPCCSRESDHFEL